MSLSGAIDRAVKAYIDHTAVVLAGDSSLNVSYLVQPFGQIAATAAHAERVLVNAQSAPAFQGSSAVSTAVLEARHPPEEEEVKGKRKKRAYKPRDPNAPKRPLTAYFRYLQEQRGPLAEEMARKHGGVAQKPGDLSKEATARWNALTKDQQQPYRDDYQDALRKYETAVEAYKAAGGQLDVEPEAEHEVDFPAQLAAAAAAVDPVDSSADADASPSPPPPTKAASPEKTKKTPKSAAKKAKAPVPPTPQFSSINPESIAPAAAPASSPEARKRKAPETPADAPDTTQKKKRKSKAKAAEPEAEPEVAPTPAPAGTEPAKKRKRKVKAGADA